MGIDINADISLLVLRAVVFPRMHVDPNDNLETSMYTCIQACMYSRIHVCTYMKTNLENTNGTDVLAINRVISQLCVVTNVLIQNKSHKDLNAHRMKQQKRRKLQGISPSSTLECCFPRKYFLAATQTYCAKTTNFSPFIHDIHFFSHFFSANLEDDWLRYLSWKVNFGYGYVLWQRSMLKKIHYLWSVPFALYQLTARWHHIKYFVKNDSHQRRVLS